MILIAYALSDMISWMTYEKTGWGWILASKTALFLESVFSCALIPLLSGFLMYSSGDDKVFRNRIFQMIISVFAVYIILLIDQLAKELPAGCSVIAADINGLKETNDTLGHYAGDELIICAAKCLCRSFTGADKIYRTGGDEFAVIIMEEGYDVDAALNRLKRYSADWRGTLIHGFSISVGAASAKEFDDIDIILKAADQRMYESKREFYENTGKDRRRR